VLKIKRKKGFRSQKVGGPLREDREKASDKVAGGGRLATGVLASTGGKF